MPTPPMQVKIPVPWIGQESSSGPTLSFNVDLDVELTGDKTGYGSLPSSPTTIYVPGSILETMCKVIYH